MGRLPADVIAQLRDHARMHASNIPTRLPGTWQQGITNLPTGHGGATLASGCLSVMFGDAFNTPFGQA